MAHGALPHQWPDFGLVPDSFGVSIEVCHAARLRQRFVDFGLEVWRLQKNAPRSRALKGGFASGLFGGWRHLDLDVAVLGATFRGRVIGGRLALAHACGFDVVGVNTVANQVGLDRLGAAQR